MHDARDAEDTRLLAAQEFNMSATVLQSASSSRGAHTSTTRGRRYSVPYRVVVHMQLVNAVCRFAELAQPSATTS
jgi:hypothetical protein